MIAEISLQLLGKVETSSTNCGSKFRIVIVEGGFGEVSIGGTLRSFSRGSIFFVGAGLELKLQDTFGLDAFLLSFDRVYLDYFLVHYPLARGIRIFEVMNFLQLNKEQLLLIDDRIKVLRSEMERCPDFEHLKMVLSLLLLDLVQDSFVVSAGHDPSGRLFVEFSEMVEQFYCEHRRTHFYARRLGVSVKRLNRLCREEWFSGKNCYRVVMDRILSQAEYLLLGTDMEVKAIGFELGFSSGANFATYFVRYKGITPVQFRKAGRVS